MTLKQGEFPVQLFLVYISTNQCFYERVKFAVGILYGSRTLQMSEKQVLLPSNYPLFIQKH